MDTEQKKRGPSQAEASCSYSNLHVGYLVCTPQSAQNTACNAASLHDLSTSFGEVSSSWNDLKVGLIDNDAVWQIIFDDFL